MDCASCIPDSATYVNAQDQDGWEMGLATPDSCGSLLTGFGKYNPSDAVGIWTTVTPVPHYWITIRVSLLYIDFWSSSSMKLYIDTKQIATSTYSGSKDIKDQCAV